MITVIGLGFVGLTTGLGFAHKGIKTFGYDVSGSKVDRISEGDIPFHEPGLKEVLNTQLGKKFFPTTDLEEAIKESQVVFVCVGTPSGDDGSADLSQIYSALTSILGHVKEGGYRVIVVKSTIPPSTTKEKIKPFIEKLGHKIGDRIGLANNPEFLREGYAWDDFINPDRIVVGVEDEKGLALLKDIYSGFDAPFHAVSFNTGEYIKYLSNTLLSTLISFANEQSMIAHSVGDIDIRNSFKILHQDKRWNGSPAPMTSYVYPGCGFGGYCLPKDTNALVAQSRAKGYHSRILDNVLKVNAEIREFHLDRIAAAVSKNVNIGVLGLAFKPDSDDVRDTPANYMISGLIKRGFKNIFAFDPIANEEFDRLYRLPVKYLTSVEDIVAKCGSVVILTAWKEFREKKQLLSGKQIFDLRYML